VLATLAVGVCAAGPASASTLLPSPTYYTAAPGETNNVVMTYRPDVRPAGTESVLRKTPQIEVVDPGVLISPSSSGTGVDRDTLADCLFLPGRAVCTQARQAPAALPLAQRPYLGDFTIYLGDGDDSARSVTDGKDEIEGGAGDDRLIGGNGGTLFRAGPGRDDMWGGYGRDTVYYDHWLSYDQTFSPATESITLDNVANDGAPGEHDNVHGDIEIVYPDGRENVVVGNWRDNELHGGSGDDEITGGTGRDLLIGSGGDDTIDAADGEADEVDCGAGTDVVAADAIDTTSSCESITS